LLLRVKIADKYHSELIIHIMDDSDIIFNLRLLNQKLDEEVRLYRNGTTPENLLELIQEKDSEIYELKKQTSITADKLRRIAKSSAEVIAKNDAIVKENNRLVLEQEQLKRQIDATIEFKRQCYEHKLRDAHAEAECLKEEVIALQKENETLNNSMDMLIPETEQFQVLIEELEEDACHRDSSIEKLQKRCHSLVLTKKDTQLALEKRLHEANADIKRKNEHLLRLSEELQKAQEFNTGIKERLSFERKNSALLSTQLLAALTDVTSAQASEARMKEKLHNLRENKNDENHPFSSVKNHVDTKTSRLGLKERGHNATNINTSVTQQTTKIVPEAAKTILLSDNA